MTPDAAAAILNVDTSASPDELKAAYRVRSKMWHPDRFASGTALERADASAEFVRITEAYELLAAQPRAVPGTTTATVPAVAEERGLRGYLGLGPRSKPGRVRSYFGFGEGK